jgi:general secretion pathway protein G
MNALKRRSGTRKGFTLLEVLMVVTIIGLLAAFVVPQLFGARRKAEVQLTEALIKSGINGTLERYRLDMGHYPREEDGGLRALVDKPDDEKEAKKWAGPYIKNAEDLRDAWQNELIYECPGSVNTDSYDLSSPGPDGNQGTDDDITNWKHD